MWPPYFPPIHIYWLKRPFIPCRPAILFLYCIWLRYTVWTTAAKPNKRRCIPVPSPFRKARMWKAFPCDNVRHHGLRWHDLEPPQKSPLQWCHNGSDGVPNHLPHHFLLNHLSRRKSNKTSQLRVTGLCAGNSPVIGEFPAQMAINAKNVSIWWRHQAACTCSISDVLCSCRFIMISLQACHDMYRDRPGHGLRQLGKALHSHVAQW